MVAGPVADLVAWKEPPVWFGESAEVTGQERGKGARYGAKQGKDFAVPRAHARLHFLQPRGLAPWKLSIRHFLSGLARECFKQRASQKTGCRQANNQTGSAVSGPGPAGCRLPNAPKVFLECPVKNHRRSLRGRLVLHYW